MPAYASHNPYLSPDLQAAFARHNAVVSDEGGDGIAMVGCGVEVRPLRRAVGYVPFWLRGLEEREEEEGVLRVGREGVKEGGGGGVEVTTRGEDKGRGEMAARKEMERPVRGSGSVELRLQLESTALSVGSSVGSAAGCGLRGVARGVRAEVVARWDRFVGAVLRR